MRFVTKVEESSGHKYDADQGDSCGARRKTETLIGVLPLQRKKMKLCLDELQVHDYHGIPFFNRRILLFQKNVV
jgi:hypothetical protein